MMTPGTTESSTTTRQTTPPLRRPLDFHRIMVMIALLCSLVMRFWIVSEGYLLPTTAPIVNTSSMTLRDFIHQDFHLAMGPAFFGFYAYFGSLIAIYQELLLLQQDISTTTVTPPRQLQSVTGASAGAMAAVLVAAGISPQAAATFCQTIDVSHFGDFPGLLAAFRGHAFEKLMHEFLATNSSSMSRLEDARVPVVVSAFDITTFQVRYLQKGSMARAARASATFPFLFQPIGWIEKDNEGRERHMLLIDGGLGDPAGVGGLSVIRSDSHMKTKRVLNLKIGSFFGKHPGPSDIPGGASEVLTLSLQNLPSCGPWAMSNGPKAVEAARRTIEAIMDLPLQQGREENHYEAFVDASKYY